ncbi:MAG: hypothetical protein K9J81_09735, partial [Desulfohalobiaceae bacterium]|nr:hypothetical protein [Desulfohalobiaceae bacterium]
MKAKRPFCSDSGIGDEKRQTRLRKEATPRQGARGQLAWLTCILIQFWFLKQRLIVLCFQRQNPEKAHLEQYNYKKIIQINTCAVALLLRSLTASWITEGTLLLQQAVAFTRRCEVSSPKQSLTRGFSERLLRFARLQPIGPRILPVEVRLRELIVYPHSYSRRPIEVT